MIGNLLINGLISGSIYSLLAIGFSLVFGVARILNMAHTAFYMVSAFLLLIFTSMMGFPILPSAVLVIFITGLLGIACYKLFFDRIKEHEIAVVLISIALAVLFQEVLLMGFGGYYYTVIPFVHGFAEIVSIRVSLQQLITVGVSLITLCVTWLILSKTRIGNAIRAVAEDRKIANLMGINGSRICMVTMGVSGGLAGISGVFIASIYTVHPLMWEHPLVVVLAAVVLGGLGSFKGAIIAAFILAFAENAVASLVPSGSFLKGAVSLSVMVIVLIIKPEGLFGVVFEEERL